MYHSPVLRVFTTHMEPCFDIPWQTKRSQKGTGSGVYIGQNEILTGAHVVNDATFIQVQKLTSPDKVVARVRSICHDADLALLCVDDEDFLSELTPADLGPLPELKDQVEVVGFPTGGEQVSITNGVVSRVEVDTYSHSWRSLLCVTIDAAINPGNSGGPVFNDEGAVVGIAFQKHTDAENSGQMIPTPVIENFLRSARAGLPLVRFSSLGLTMQTLENPALRSRFKVPATRSGLLVTTVEFGSSSWGLIHPEDVLHTIDHYEISNMGTILYRDKYRTSLSAHLSELAEGEVVRVSLTRAGEQLSVEIPLTAAPCLVPREEDVENRYFIYGGLVFQPLTRKYLQTWRHTSSSPPALRYFYHSAQRTPELTEVVVLAQVLSDEVNVGYDDFYYEVITEVNGERVRDLNHLVTLLEGCEGVVELRTHDKGWIVLDSAQVRARDPELLRSYQVPADRRGV